MRETHLHMMLLAILDSEKREKESADKLFSLLPEDQEKEIRELWEEFEKEETEDAKYASAIDCLQSFLLIYYTGGTPWKTYNVTSAQAYKRQGKIKDVIPELWEFVDGLIQDAVKKGYLK